jgi:hypothetical protein
MNYQVSQQGSQKTVGIEEILPVFPSRATLHNQQAQAVSIRLEGLKRRMNIKLWSPSCFRPS